MEDNILLLDEYSNNATFCCNQMGNFSVDLNKINFDDTSYDEDDPGSIIHIRFLAGILNLKNAKYLKKI